MIELDQTELINELVDWLLIMLRPTPAWRGASLELKPTPDRVWVRGRCDDPYQPQDFAGDIKRESSGGPLARRLQRACFQPGRGTWVSALIETWPTGPETCATHGMFNYDQDPGSIAGDDGEFTGSDLVAHLEEFPRPLDQVPPWMRERIEEAGLRVPWA